MTMHLTLRPRPMPPFDGLSPLLRAQPGPLREQAESDGPEGADLIALFDVLDEEGRHRYDLHLFCDDDGQLHLAGALEPVASVSQGGATGSHDPTLLAALAAWVASRP